EEQGHPFLAVGGPAFAQEVPGVLLRVGDVEALDRHPQMTVDVGPRRRRLDSLVRHGNAPGRRDPESIRPRGSRFEARYSLSWSRSQNSGQLHSASSAFGGSSGSSNSWSSSLSSSTVSTTPPFSRGVRRRAGSGTPPAPRKARRR